MDIQVSSEASIPTPAAGFRTLFIDTDKGNILYYKNSDGTFTPFVGDASTDMTEIAEAWSKGLTCALNSGMITPSDYQSILDTGLVIVSSSNVDVNGNTTTTVSIGARDVPLISIAVGADTASISVGSPTSQISVTFNPTTASNKQLSFVSGDLTVATVNSTGLISRVSSGATTISVIPLADPSKTKTVTVTSS